MVMGNLMRWLANFQSETTKIPLSITTFKMLPWLKIGKASII